MYQSGPAILKLGTGPYLYFAEGLKGSLKSKLGQTPVDFFGKDVDPFLISQTMTFTGRPTMVTGAILAALFPYSATAIGSSVFGASDVPLTIWTKDGQQIVWTRGALTKAPKLSLSAAKPSIYAGDVEFTCLGAATTSAETSETAAGHWNTITSTAFADTSFSGAAIQGYRMPYTAAFGSTPYNAMTAQGGFEVEIDFTTEEIADDNIGIGDMMLTDVQAKCTFVPSNLTEAQVYTLLALQGSGARQPGDSIGSSGTNLVIGGSSASQSTSLTVTLNKAGFHDMGLEYMAGKLRAGQLAAISRRTWTTGAVDALFTFAVT